MPSRYQKAHFQFFIHLTSYSNVRFRAKLLALCAVVKLPSVRAESRTLIKNYEIASPYLSSTNDGLYFSPQIVSVRAKSRTIILPKFKRGFDFETLVSQVLSLTPTCLRLTPSSLFCKFNIFITTNDEIHLPTSRLPTSLLTLIEGIQQDWSKLLYKPGNPL
jgi:hypothetical protein